MTRIAPAAPRGSRSGPIRLELTGTEAFRFYFDAQEMGACHKAITEGTKAAVSRSVWIPHKGALSADEMRRLSDAVGPYGFGISDTGEGVTLMKLRDTGGDVGPQDGAALRKLLRGELGDPFERALPGGKERAARAAG